MKVVVHKFTKGTSFSASKIVIFSTRLVGDMDLIAPAPGKTLIIHVPDRVRIWQCGNRGIDRV